MINIAGNKVSLRALSFDDHLYIHKWKNDNKLNYQLLAHPLPFSMEKAKKWIEDNNKDENQAVFGIIPESKSEDIIGIARLMFIDRINNNTELGIFIASPEHRGEGLGLEALCLILNFAMTDLNLNRVYLRVAADNKLAVSLYEKVGFVKEGLLRKQVWRKGGYHDVVLMGILKDEFRRSNNLTVRAKIRESAQ